MDPVFDLKIAAFSTSANKNKCLDFSASSPSWFVFPLSDEFSGNRAVKQKNTNIFYFVQRFEGIAAMIV